MTITIYGWSTSPPDEYVVVSQRVNRADSFLLQRGEREPLRSLPGLHACAVGDELGQTAEHREHGWWLAGSRR
jgi:hypothetical protein